MVSQLPLYLQDALSVLIICDDMTVDKIFGEHCFQQGSASAGHRDICHCPDETYTNTPIRLQASTRRSWQTSPRALADPSLVTGLRTMSGPPQWPSPRASSSPR